MAGTNYKISFEAACPGEQAVELVADVFEPLPSSNEEPKVGAVSALSGMVCVVMGWGNASRRSIHAHGPGMMLVAHGLPALARAAFRPFCCTALPYVRR